jgi:hypothetical protein
MNSSNRLQAAANNGGKVRPNVPVNLNLPKINLPTQPARLINFQVVTGVYTIVYIIIVFFCIFECDNVETPSLEERDRERVR